MRKSHRRVRLRLVSHNQKTNKISISTTVSLPCKEKHLMPDLTNLSLTQKIMKIKDHNKMLSSTMKVSEK